MAREPREVCLNAAMGAFQRGTAWRHSLQLLRPDSIAENAAVKALGPRWRQVLCLSGRGSVRLASSVAKGLAERWPLALAALAVELRGGQADQVSRNGRLAALRWRQALCALAGADAYGHNSAVGACARGVAWHHALQLYQSMAPKSLRPDEVSVNSVTSALQGLWLRGTLEIAFGAKKALEASKEVALVARELVEVALGGSHVVPTQLHHHERLD